MKATHFLIVALILTSPVGNELAAAEKNAKGHDRKPAHRIARLGLPNRTLSNINNISSWYDDDGTQEFNSTSFNSGLTYPRQTATAVYTAGLMWGGQFNDGRSPQVRVNGQSYNTGTQRGAILGIRTGIAEHPDAPDVRIWRVRRDYFTADLLLDAAEIFEIPPDIVTTDQIQAVRDQYATDWTEWPAHKGAPFYDSDGDGIYMPEFLGTGEPVLFPDADEPGLADADQVVWYVCNDLTAQPWTDVQSGIEQQSTIWAYNRLDPLGNAVFKRLRLLFKGIATTSENASIDDMYLCQWSDPDIGTYTDDFSGCDSARGLGYGYNGDAVDDLYNGYGLDPPAAGYDLLQGPITYTGIPSDTAVFDFRKISGAKNLPVTSFIYFAAGGLYSDPPFTADGGIQWYQMLRGLPPNPPGPPDPPPFINPVTGQPSSFWLNGDPVTGTGWIDGLLEGPGDRRFLLSSGPISLALGDTQEIIVATITGLGSSHLNSITQLRTIDDSVQSWFNDLVGFDFPTDVDNSDVEVPRSFALYQNYPNPFNPKTDFGFHLPAIHGSQGQAGITDYGSVSLNIFDLLGREVATIVNEQLPPGRHTRQWDASGLASGVYFYRLQTTNFTETKKLVILR